MVNIPKEHNSLKKVYVDTTNVATQIDSPKVYYKIKPEIGYVICGYCNICFILREDADLDKFERALPEALERASI